MKHKKIISVILAIPFVMLCSLPAFAVSEAEVEAAVASQGKEAVSGNLFIWFLCAIAFLKVSTKLDSFMQALGLGVGRPQGSLLTEALMAMRGMEFGKALGGIVGGKMGSHHGGGRASATPASLSGGLAGVVGRHLENQTANAMGGVSSGGLASSIGGSMYHGSLGKEGGFASRVIGSVATGENPGVISGDTASEALGGYFGTTSDALSEPIPGSPGDDIGNDAPTMESIPDTQLAMDGSEPIPVSSEDSGAVSGGGSFSGGEAGTIPTSPSIQQAAMSRVLSGQMGNPTRDVEIGGGKITGREVIPGRGQIQFAMYNASQFEKPSGHYTTQTSLDGQKWYKVYASSAVEKTPTTKNDRGHYQYDERKVAQLPKAPARRRS